MKNLQSMSIRKLIPFKAILAIATAVLLACSDSGEYSRCLNAATNYSSWVAYCNTLYGGTIAAICHSNENQSTQIKNGFCAKWWGPYSGA